MPRAAYEGNSPPVKYAAFVELQDPYLRAQLWRKFNGAQKHEVNVLLGHFKSQVQRQLNMLSWFQKFSFLYTTASAERVGLQAPHYDLEPWNYTTATVKLGFMPLDESGMFLEVWAPGNLFGEIVFVKYGTIFIIDKEVVHAGGFSESGRRMQFCFSSKVLDIAPKQIKTGIIGRHNNNYETDEVRSQFS